MVGQPYRIVVEMEMPESEANQELGMFMVCVEMKDAEYSTVGRSCRSAILRYKSFLHHAITTFAFAPFLLAGSAEEKQLVTVELFPRFQEDPVSLRWRDDVGLAFCQVTHVLHIM
jgi:seipin